MNTQTVNVTAEIIERGERGDCPIGCALCQGTGLAWFVGDIVAYVGGSKMYYVIDPSLREIISSFDTTGTMSPLTLIINHDAKTITVQS